MGFIHGKFLIIQKNQKNPHQVEKCTIATAQIRCQISSCLLHWTERIVLQHLFQKDTILIKWKKKKYLCEIGKGSNNFTTALNSLLKACVS